MHQALSKVVINMEGIKDSKRLLEDSSRLPDSWVYWCPSFLLEIIFLLADPHPQKGWSLYSARHTPHYKHNYHPFSTSFSENLCSMLRSGIGERHQIKIHRYVDPILVIELWYLTSYAMFLIFSKKYVFIWFYYHCASDQL